MKNLITPSLVLSLSFLFSFSTFSQVLTYEEATNGGLTPAGVSKLNDRIEDRSGAMDFYKTMRRIAEPSTISFFPFDHTWQQNDADQKKNFVLNADIQTPIAMGGKWWITRLNRRNPAFHTVHIIPHFRVRIFKDDPKFNDVSLPVRTPSYMPGITYYCTHKKSWRQRKYIPDSTAIDKMQKGFFFGFKLFHHSNGQDGPEFNTNGTLNVYNGNFGENIVPEIIIGQAREYRVENKGGKLVFISNRNTFKDLLGEEKSFVPNRYFYWKLSVEPHLGKVFGIPMTSEVFDSLNIYGRLRVNYQMGWSIIPYFRELVNLEGKKVIVARAQEKEFMRAVLNINYIADGKYYSGNIDNLKKVGFFNLGRRMNIYASLHVRVKGTQHASAFIQFGYFGSDNYNIYFQQRLLHFRAGISTAFYKYPSSRDLEPATME